ncbi:exodeoxyribonuclease VII large subunit [Desulfogranum mediterraneum]|uniref:exodeoxyribonuclease VII large subunit n=1 Tax=Desulfogranum mediterraneum TaxID=160661 RepID=UPI00040F63E4|nr:exodeoxyribonuclease VII large subunit [Desulfogranum mediterraneum]
MDTSQHVYSVRQLNREIRSLLEGRYPFISVAGEISSLRRPYSGHLYFTLKDADAQIKGVLFKMQQRYLSEELREGMQVVCRGRISVYEPRGDYQLIVDRVDFRGAGELQVAFERLKRRLAEEGLFEAASKRPLPGMPEQITLVTSPSGAAVHDFLQVAARRFPLTAIQIYPVTVQGEQAAGEISQAIAELNRLGQTEIIVLCRGGGSMEDLWAFNDEQLARVIHASTIPVVNAVGHEIDFTIADFVADLRAPTPSAAAELLLPDIRELADRVAILREALLRALGRSISEGEHRLRLQQHRLEAMPHPLDTISLKLDHLSTALAAEMSALISQKNQLLQRAAAALDRNSPQLRLDLHGQQLQALGLRLSGSIQSLIRRREEQLHRAAGVLDAVSPLATLARGYAIARKPAPRATVITSPEQVRTGEKIEVLVHGGKIDCLVEPAEGR